MTGQGLSRTTTSCGRSRFALRRAWAKARERRNAYCSRKNNRASLWQPVRRGSMRTRARAAFTAPAMVDRGKIGDYLVVAQGLQSDRQPEVVSQLMAQLDFIGRYLVTDADRESYRLWVRDLLSPVAEEVGWKKKPSESEEKESLRKVLLGALGGVARDPEVQAFARKLVDQ